MWDGDHEWVGVKASKGGSRRIRKMVPWAFEVWYPGRVEDEHNCCYWCLAYQRRQPMGEHIVLDM